jgi:hypothetical protein
VQLGVGQLVAGLCRRSPGFGFHLEIAEAGLLAEAVQIPMAPVIGLEALDEVRVEGRVLRRNAEVGRALEDRQVVGFLRDHGDRLDGRRAGSDDADALAGEADRMVRPEAGLMAFTRERVETGNVRHLGHRQAAGRHDAESGTGAVARIGFEPPLLRVGVEARGGHAPAETDVVAQPEAAGHMARVVENFRLRRVAFGPLPVLLQLRRERVRIGQALGVAARARVSVPVPGAADVVAGLVDAHAQAQLTQAMQHVHAGEPGTDHDGVEGGVPIEDRQ